jgi:hypothetical protein
MKSTFLHGRVIVIIVSGLLFTTLFAPYAAGHELVAWGSQKTPNAPLSNLTKIAAGSYHNIALKSDGSIVGWGNNSYGQATPPAGNNFIAIAAGDSHSLALKSDGSIVGWGNNWYGQATPPAGNNFTAIAADDSFSLALRQTVPAPTPCTAPSWCGGADINKDGHVDFEDFAIVANHWLEGN